jgi:multicomponent Na+:H+ antiporter subunit B
VSSRARLSLFAVAGAGLAAVLVIGFTGLSSFGDYHGVYGQVIDGIGVTVRHGTDLITALNFDIRGFDTLGEEFILFTSVLGIVLILREMRGEHEQPHEEESEEHSFGGASEALRALVLGVTLTLVALGVYIVVHGQLTPGGGFQGGVILAAGPLPVFLAGRYLRMRLIAPHRVVELADSLGAAGYALVGLSGLVFVGVFFKDAVPLGIPGHLLSGGQMDIASVLVGLEVSGAFLVAWSEFLDQAIVIRSHPSGTQQ